MFVLRNITFAPSLNYSNLCLLLILLITWQTTLPASAQTELYELAVKEYKNHHYKVAAKLFDEYLLSEFTKGDPALKPDNSENPATAYAMFYEAVCLEQIGNFKDAANLYQLVVRRYKESPLAMQAEKFLQSKRSQSKNILPNEPTRDPGLDFFPKETWVPFKRYGNLMLVDGSINGRSIQMLFDTGAAGCLFSTDQLKSLGIEIPSGAPTTAIAGVGTKRQTPAWTIYADLRLGRIERRKFPVQINENPLNYPLVGMNFVEGLEYTIDNDANVIQFKAIPSNRNENAAQKISPRVPGGPLLGHVNDTDKKRQFLGVEGVISSQNPSTNTTAGKMSITVDSSSRYVYSVPFVEMNRAIIVSTKISGKDCEMILDTGTDICLFASSQLRVLNLSPKLTGRTLTCKGAAGYMNAPVCIFEQAEFGPIRGPMACLVSSDATLPLPLLGQNFLKDWQITIDHTNHLVKLIRK